jgi:DNA-binding beta-propeller fold protein YncE
MDMGNYGTSFAALALLVCSVALAGCSNATSESLPKNSGSLAPSPSPSLQYIGQWGVKGNDPGQLSQPSGIAADALGDVFLADSGSAFISKFAFEGKPLLSFQEDGMNHPQSITVDHGGAIYVADPVRDSVFIFLPNGDRFRELHLRTRPNAENSLSVAVGDDGLIHVLDPTAGKIFTYTIRMRLVQTSEPRETIPGKGRFGPIVKGPDDFLYLGTPSGGIMKLTHDGHLITELVAAAGAQWNPNSGFAVWSNAIFVMDANGLMVHVVGTDGAPKLDVDLAPQLGQGNRRAPALAVSPRPELLVLDSPETRVLRYRISF